MMLQNVLTLKNPLRYMLVIFCAFLAVAYVYNGDGTLSESSKILLTVTSFVFGFYINNLISHARAGHSKVVESLREEGGYMKAIYLVLISSFSEEQVARVRGNMDDYLTAGMDYKIYDYSKSYPEFKKLYTELMNLSPESKQQDGGWNQIIRIISEVSKNRTRIETSVKERVSTFEWLTISVLLVVVLYFIFSLSTGTWTSIILTASIATTLTMLLIILYSLDSLRWKEDKWFWEPIEELFKSLDLLPYYSDLLIKSGRVKVKSGKNIRVASYPHPYPDMSEKKVRILK